MTAITADELSHRTDDVLRRVRDAGETIEIVEEGAVVARLVPAAPAAPTLMDGTELDSIGEEIGRWAAEQDARWRQEGDNAGQLAAPSVEGQSLTPEEKAELDAWLADIDRVAEEITKYWPEGVSAVDAVREQRRELVPEEWTTPEDEHEQLPMSDDDHHAFGTDSTEGRGL